MSAFQIQPARALLHEQRISNTALAKRAGCSTTFVSQVLLGHRRPPSGLQRLLADVLERPIEDLFTREALAPASRFPGDCRVAAGRSAGS
ncbi:hypothetical protein acdb102_16120 [Acidothermaceae bacterium B102]|nr:hypothetical protein acdb102_16120 [Acidothermaceae bacterium B102]